MTNVWLKNIIDENEKEITEILLLKFPESHVLKNIILPTFNKMIRDLKILSINSVYGSSFSPQVDNSNLEHNIDNVLERLKDNLNLQEEERKLYEKVFIDRLFWREVSRSNKLNENFIEEYNKLLDFDEISKYQNLSYEFVTKNKEILNFEFLNKNQNIKDKKLKTFIKINNL